MEAISNNPNVVSTEQYEQLQKKFFKLQSAQETRECLSRVFLDVMCYELADDTQYRREIITTFETVISMVVSIEEGHDPYDNLTLTITNLNI